MKNIFILIIIITTISCKAQSVIKSLDGDGSCPPYDSDCYEKDINNEFDKFVGEWKYTEGDTSLTLKLKKEEHYQIREGRNFMDLLVGEYRYMENGTEVVNTLANFDDTSIKGYRHKISGGVFIRNLPSYCTDNSMPQEIKIGLQIEDPNDSFIEGYVILRYVNDNGSEKLEVCIYDETTMADDVNARIAIPDGYYEFIKQE